MDPGRRREDPNVSRNCTYAKSVDAARPKQRRPLESGAAASQAATTGPPQLLQDRELCNLLEHQTNATFIEDSPR